MTSSFEPAASDEAGPPQLHTSLTCRLLPPTLQWLLGQAPAFPVHSDNVRIITEPAEFYEVLLERINSANTRISLASLYLGNGKLEQQLVRAVQARLSSTPSLSVQWLLDYTRGSRQPGSSRQVLQPLLGHANCQVSLFHTPELRGLVRRLLPQRWNEIVGLQHMKLYIFDDALLISGANLSADYFTQRQDRYFLVTAASELCDFLQAVVTVVARHSILLVADGSVTLHPQGIHHPFLGNKRKYCEAVEADVRRLWLSEITRSVDRIVALNTDLQQGSISEDISSSSQCSKTFPLPPRLRALGQTTAETNPSLVPSSAASQVRRNLSRDATAAGSVLSSRPPDTLVFPTLQMNSFNIRYDAAVTKRLLSSASADSLLHLASGYFNLTNAYMDCLLQSTDARCSILSAHPEANGFLGASGVAGAIPAAYTQLARSFLSRVAALGQERRLQLWEYRRSGWTFHAKGLWYTEPNSTSPDGRGEVGDGDVLPAPCLSLVGSPNFGWRSVYRDLESQLVVVTGNPELQQRLGAERAGLFGSASLVRRKETFAQPDRYVKFWVRAVVPIIKRFF